MCIFVQLCSLSAIKYSDLFCFSNTGHASVTGDHLSVALSAAFVKQAVSIVTKLRTVVSNVTVTPLTVRVFHFNNGDVTW